MRLSDLVKDEANRNVKKQFVYKKEESIFDYFGSNQELIDANNDKKFTYEDKIALIVNSQIISLDRRIRDLNKIKSEVSEEIGKQIDLWIDNQHKKLDYVRQIDDNDIVFVVCYPNNYTGTGRVFRKYDEAIQAPAVEKYGIAIEKIQCDNRSFTRGSISFNNKKEVSNISLLGFEDFKLPKTDLYNYTFHPNLVFKPYDLMHILLFDKSSIVVADTTKLAINREDVIYDEGWIEVNIPIVEMGYGFNGNEGYGPGGFIIKKCFGSIENLRRFTAYEMSKEQQEWIDNIREQVNKLEK